MKFQNFIILEERPRNIRSGREVSETLSGQVFLPIGKSLPIILRGTGCIGIGLVTELRITEQSTTVTFTSSEVSDEYAEAYYALYQNQISVDNSDDPYEQTDQIIPGAMGQSIGRTRTSERIHGEIGRSNKYTSDRHGMSLADYGDDDYHWD